VQTVTSLSSSVTAPFRASTRPRIDAFVFIVIDVRAMMVPTKAVPVPRVAELPTCQNTLQALTPPMRVTLEFDAVMSVLAIWKTKMSVELPLSVRLPVSPADDV
jgi:hypothetical protein